MTTLEELQYYCKENAPAGALMLTGEWGCGKTYLIEHELSETLQDYIILRISLFGIASVVAIQDAVKKAWFTSYLDDKNWGNASKIVERAQKLLEKLPIPDKMKDVVSFDLVDVISITPWINKKAVVLVFDDLERTRLDYIDIMGCINDYCENQQFHTIIVANEDILNQRNEVKVNPDTGTLDNTSKVLSYAEIKEKIVQRTIRYKPDYRAIVQAVINENRQRDDRYNIF